MSKKTAPFYLTEEIRSILQDLTNNLKLNDQQEQIFFRTFRAILFFKIMERLQTLDQKPLKKLNNALVNTQNEYEKLELLFSEMSENNEIQESFNLFMEEDFPRLVKTLYKASFSS